jgi:hypothetical protein
MELRAFLSQLLFNNSTAHYLIYFLAMLTTQQVSVNAKPYRVTLGQFQHIQALMDSRRYKLGQVAKTGRWHWVEGSRLLETANSRVCNDLVRKGSIVLVGSASTAVQVYGMSSDWQYLRHLDRDGCCGIFYQGRPMIID